MKLLKSPGSGPGETPHTAQLLHNTNPKSLKEKKTLGRRANSFPEDLPLSDAERRPLLFATQSIRPAGVHLRKEKNELQNIPAYNASQINLWYLLEEYHHPVPSLRLQGN